MTRAESRSILVERARYRSISTCLQRMNRIRGFFLRKNERACFSCWRETHLLVAGVDGLKPGLISRCPRMRNARRLPNWSNSFRQSLTSRGPKVMLAEVNPFERGHDHAVTQTDIGRVGVDRGYTSNGSTRPRTNRGLLPGQRYMHRGRCRHLHLQPLREAAGYVMHR